MTRRSFFSTLAKAAAGFAILPAATTYVRNWHGVYVPWTRYEYEQNCNFVTHYSWKHGELHVTATRPNCKSIGIARFTNVPEDTLNMEPFELWKEYGIVSERNLDTANARGLFSVSTVG